MLGLVRAVAAELQQRLNDSETGVRLTVDLKQIVTDCKGEAKKDMDKMAESSNPSHRPKIKPHPRSRSRGGGGKPPRTSSGKHGHGSLSSDQSDDGPSEPSVPAPPRRASRKPKHQEPVAEQRGYAAYVVFM